MFRYAIVSLFLLFNVSSQGQVLISLLLGDKLNSGEIEFGLDGGLTRSYLDGIDPSKGLNTFNLGFYFDFKLKRPGWMLNTGVRVKSNVGAQELNVYPLNNFVLDSAFIGGSITRQMSYFYVPVTMKYMFKNNFYAQAGIQLGLGYKASDKFYNTVEEDDDLSYALNVRHQYHPLDGGLLAGVGYRITKGLGMNLGVQYYYGLVDVLISDATPDVKNSAFYFNVGIPIGKGAAAKQAAKEGQK